MACTIFDPASCNVAASDNACVTAYCTAVRRWKSGVRTKPSAREAPAYA